MAQALLNRATISMVGSTGNIKAEVLMHKRWIEFFEGENNRLSMMRLTVFLSFFPASYVVIVTKSETIFGWFVSAYVFGYIGGKGADVMGRKLNAKPSTK